jgi:hypothetical protein
LATADLLIADMPDGSIVLGLSTEVPDWNKMGDFYTSIFTFASKHLDDDGGAILLMPIGVIDGHDFIKLLEKYNFQISVDWLCHQPLPLAHPNYESKLVRCLAYSP